MREYSIAAIPADGIGPEVIAAGIAVLESLQKRVGDIKFTVETFDWGSVHSLGGTGAALGAAYMHISTSAISAGPLWVPPGRNATGLKAMRDHASPTPMRSARMPR